MGLLAGEASSVAAAPQSLSRSRRLEAVVTTKTRPSPRKMMPTSGTAETRRQLVGSRWCEEADKHLLVMAVGPDKASEDLPHVLQICRVSGSMTFICTTQFYLSVHDLLFCFVEPHLSPFKILSSGLLLGPLIALDCSRCSFASQLTK